MKKSFEKAITEIRKLGFTEPPAPATRVNPFTGACHVLEPLAVMVYDFITTAKFVCGRDYSRQTWDNARYGFAEVWPNEYYDLLD